MDFSQFYTSTDHFTIAPAIMLVLFGCAILLFDFFPFLGRRRDLLLLLAIGEAFAGYGLFQQHRWLSANPVPLQGFHNSVAIDSFSIFFNWIFLIAALVVAIASYKYLEVAGGATGEYTTASTCAQF